MAQLQDTVDRIVAAQAPDGWYGPHDRPISDGERYWRQYPLLLALTQYAEAAEPAHSAAIVASLRRFLHGFAEWVQQTNLQSWSRWRWQDMAMTAFRRVAIGGGGCSLSLASDVNAWARTIESTCLASVCAVFLIY